MRVHETVARTLADLGTDTLFGLMGDANMLYVADFQGMPGHSYVGAVGEGAAVSMADGFARVSGRVGVCTVTHGPGATNMITSLTEAVRARTALIVLTGDTPAAARDHVQRVDLAAVAHVAQASYRKVSRAEDLQDELIRAFEQAGRGVPVVVNIPVDFMLEEIDPAPVTTHVRMVSDQVLSQSDELDNALGLIASARRPLVIAGRGAGHAETAIVRLADLLGAPLGTSLLGKGLFTDHPCHLGVIGSVGHEVAIDATVAADVVISFGAGLNHFTTSEGSLFDGCKVVQCDIEPTRFGQMRHADVEIVGDARFTATFLADAIAAADLGRTTDWSDTIARRLAARDPLAGVTEHPSPGTVDMRSVMHAVNTMLPADRTVVTDCGRFMLAPWQLLSVESPRAFTHTVSFGSIGLGLATAIGASVANRSRITVVVGGDGGAMMSMIEFQTAVRLGLPLVFIVLNDGSYGSEYERLEHYGVDPRFSLLEWPSFAEIARAMGGHAMTVAAMDELDELERVVAGQQLPVLVEVVADPSVDIGSVR